MLQQWNQFIKKLRATIQYNDYYRGSKQEIIELLNYYSHNKQKVAIWGGGLKGVSFLNCIDPQNKSIECVVDMNPKLHGTTTSTGHKIVSYQYLLEQNINIVLVMNKVFYVDVYLLLQKNNFKGLIIDMDEMVEQKLDCKDIINKKQDIDIKKDSSIFGYTLRDIQLTALDILIEVDRVCKKNNIRYFLEAGSALGVERYKGFIPCDDDIDIGMFRDDYNKFQEVASSELNSGYMMQKIMPGYDYPYPYMQVVKDNTSFVRLEFKKARMHHGIHIDIAPIDNVPNDKKLREKQIRTIRKYTNIIRKKLIPEPYESKNPIKCFIVNSPYYLLKVVPLSLLIKRQQKEFVRYKNVNTDYVGDLCTHYKKDIFFSKDTFFPTLQGEFEDKLFPIPNDMDKYLTIMYDDYKMISPREDGSIKYRMADVSLERNYEVSTSKKLK